MTSDDRPGAAVVVSLVTAALATAGTYLFLVPAGCNDIGGVSSWQRCVSAMGTPAFSVEDWGLDATLNVLSPLLIGIAVGLITWWAIERIV
jgi:NhaP-type Na+/H+ or K+/H+ antiporter